jgi:hypothetical protein
VDDRRVIGRRDLDDLAGRRHAHDRLRLVGGEDQRPVARGDDPHRQAGELPGAELDDLDGPGRRRGEQHQGERDQQHRWQAMTMAMHRRSLGI